MQKGAAMKIVGLIVSLFCCTWLYPIVIVGHRGASGYAPENTLYSCAKAIECGVDMIECDVRLCASGELVVFHDAMVDRITDGCGYIADKTLQELKNLKIFGNERIITLVELLDFVNRKAKIYIELKSFDSVYHVLKLIEEYVYQKKWSDDDFLIASFDHTQLQVVKQLNSNIAIAVLLYGIPVTFGACASAIEADIVCLDVEFITQQFVDDIHARGMLVYVYTVNDIKDFTHILSFGIDGIITDYPDYIRALLS